MPNHSHIPPGFSVIKEGTACLLSEKKNKVFYNEVQVKNRDLSILVINEYAKQLEVEANAQIERRKRALQWRKLSPTVSTWGESYTKEEEAFVENKEVKQEEYNIAKDKLKLDGLYILEALGASGLRSIRYSNEITEGVGVDRIVCNDLEAHAVENFKQNLEYNTKVNSDSAAVERLKTKVFPSNADATQVMMQHRLSAGQKTQHTRIINYFGLMGGKEKEPYSKNYDSEAFDVVDIDPYGSSAPFLDSAVQSVRDGGLLCITNTDLAVLCGKDIESCYSRYGAMGLRAKYAHEYAIRVVLGTISRLANRHNRFIVPQLSIQTDFYLRCFIRVYSNKAVIKTAATKLGYVFQSSQCPSFYVQPVADLHDKGYQKPPKIKAPSVCPETGAEMVMGGPIWIDPIHNSQFVKALLAKFSTNEATKNPYMQHWTKDELRREQTGKFNPNSLESGEILFGILTAISEEVNTKEACLFYHIPQMMKTLKSSTPPHSQIASAVCNAGFKVSQVHMCAQGLKTDAPANVIWDILRAWVKKTSVGEFSSKKASEETVALRNKILNKEGTTDVNFTMHPDVLKDMRKRKGTYGDGEQSQTKKVARWKNNPKPNWGPKSRAKGRSNFQTHKK